MLPKSVLITGCNRGIGLELVKQFSKSPETTIVIATCRDLKAATDLKVVASLYPGKVSILALEVTDYSAYPKFVEEVLALVGNTGLNLLINNAGYLPDNRLFNEVTPDDMRKAFEVNCIAPLLLARALLPLIQVAAKCNSKKPVGIARASIVHMSSSVGSIAENASGGRTGGYAYRCSKSALNQMMKSMSVDLKENGILIMSMHPGWVQTDMGGANADITTETCCSTMVKTLEGLTEKDDGSFKRYDNSIIPW